MKKWVLSGFIAILLIVCVFYGVYRGKGGAPGLVVNALPEFPI